jgi:hypothetical protein
MRYHPRAGPPERERTLRVSGEDAKLYDAVSLSSFANVNRGELVSADDSTGEVVYKDTPESTKAVTLGDHAIRIVKRGR